MKKLFQATLLVISCIPLFGADEWLYYKHFPWVYDHQSKEWIYLNGSADGKIYVYPTSSKVWVSMTEYINPNSDSTSDNQSETNDENSNNQVESDWDINKDWNTNYAYQKYTPDNVTATRESGVMKVFIDINLLNHKSNNSSIGSNTWPLVVGGNGKNSFNGLIDDVRIYDRALSAEEVQALYNMGQ